MRFARTYSVEISLTLLGILAGGLEAVVANNTDIALIIWVNTALLALAVVAIRHEIADQVGEALADRQWVERIADDRWRSDARAERDQLRAKFASWGGGTRKVHVDSSLNYQMESLRTARESVWAIHLATEASTLKAWVNTQRGFYKLVETFRELPVDLDCCRILVLDEGDPAVSQVSDGRRVICSELVRSVCELQTKPRPGEGLGFDLRVHWTHRDDRSHADLLLIDKRESCSIENLGRGRFSDLEVCVNASIVAEQVRVFDDLWTAAVPFDHCI